jgi:hypothetical protein
MAMTDQEREHLLERARDNFGQRLRQIAADPTQWITFIEQVAVFGAQYSLGNQWLLLMQAAERDIQPRYFLPFGAKDGTSGWKAVGRRVRTGETGFLVWAPVRRRPSEEQAAEWEAAGRRVARDPRGRPAVQVVGFRPSWTFELSQTDGADFEPPTVARKRMIKAIGGQAAQLLAGDDPTGAYEDTVALINEAGYQFELVPPGAGHLGAANGVTVCRGALRLVQVRDDVGAAQRIKTTMHELAHIRCGHLDADPGDGQLHRGRRETEAESVAHLVCRVLGLDTQAYSDAYVLGWADGDLELVQACAEKVIKVSRSILDDLSPAGDPAPVPMRRPGERRSGNRRAVAPSRAR